MPNGVRGTGLAPCGIYQLRLSRVGISGTLRSLVFSEGLGYAGRYNLHSASEVRINASDLVMIFTIGWCVMQRVARRRSEARKTALSAAIINCSEAISRRNNRD